MRFILAVYLLGGIYADYHGYGSINPFFFGDYPLS